MYCLRFCFAPLVSGTLQPGFRNEFHAGLQQAFGKHLVLSGDYIWKYTHNAFDFSVLGNTPITFPIDWHNSKIPGFDFARTFRISTVSLPLSSCLRLRPVSSLRRSRVQARLLLGGISFPHRPRRTIQRDHPSAVSDPRQTSPWFGFNWRLDSGLTAGAVPCYNVTDPNSLCACHWSVHQD